MTRFRVPDMSCGHCEAAIEAAVRAVDPSAEIDVDLEGRTVNVDGDAAAESLLSAMAEAGYPAEVLA
jgi:copper chaperone